MKILYIALSCGPNLGSEDAVGWNVPLEAVRHGHDVTVLTRSDKREEIETYIAANPRDVYPVFIYRELPKLSTVCKGPLYTIRAKMWCKAVSKEIGAICRSKGFDVIHQITPVEFRAIVDMTGIPALKVVGPMGGGGKIDPLFKHAYLTLGQRIIEAFLYFFNYATVFNRKSRKGLISHDLVLAANHETEIMLRKMGWTKPVVVCSEVAVKSVMEKTEKDKNTYIIGFAGRLHYRKGILFLLDVFSLLNKPGWELRIVGEGPEKRRIEKRIKQLHLQGKVKLLGRLSYQQMEDFYRSLNVFAFPSFREATGSVLVEALAAGAPVIAFDAFGAHEVLKELPQSLVPVEGDLNIIIKNFSNAVLHMTEAYDPNFHCVPQTWEQHAEALIDLYMNERTAC